ncbi:sulfur transport family protein [Yersinia rohdei]|uniref:Putative transmembrane protein n=1 Tax=Yersinia rohdei TaxID=29485 RepID=A0A0U1HXX8_YERRO|nr:YeeE/YedE thiosulfate transporter family protein [Yersinia rohdei]AJJ10670.1 sulfur transport family protein [Yersinia rohdei]MDN0095243.1 YeeE/YedE thiosulfate transporter family protein [Yersinia rohdei]CNF33821.1 putative transmembrane protein [Yersinia rohdei]CNI83112.1 putative transmembrane protein [Yersinia rohdei]CQI96729.1 putative transmembrane protein [Yersinia rohdei]
MTIDWANFTPYTALAGGAILGIAVTIFLLWNGRITGISGILGGLLPPKKGDISWRVAFIIGLIISPVIYSLFAVLPAIQIEADLPVLILAGLFVGIGTRYGAGCTSGHGVCGLARFSPRSLVATLSFMLTGFITVGFVRHLFI